MLLRGLLLLVVPIKLLGVLPPLPLVAWLFFAVFNKRLLVLFIIPFLLAARLLFNRRLLVKRLVRLPVVRLLLVLRRLLPPPFQTLSLVVRSLRLLLVVGLLLVVKGRIPYHGFIFPSSSSLDCWLSSIRWFMIHCIH